MKKLSLYFLMMAIGFIAFSQKIDKSQVPDPVKKLFETKINDTLTPVWEKKGDDFLATFPKAALKGEVWISSKTEWVKTIWTMPYEYVPQKIKDNVLTSYAGFKVSKASIRQSPDGDYYVIEAKKKKEIQTILYNLKGEFVKVEPAAGVIIKNEEKKEEKK